MRLRGAYLVQEATMLILEVLLLIDLLQTLQELIVGVARIGVPHRILEAPVRCGRSLETILLIAQMENTRRFFSCRSTHSSCFPVLWSRLVHLDGVSVCLQRALREGAIVWSDKVVLPQVFAVHVLVELRRLPFLVALKLAIRKRSGDI